MTQIGRKFDMGKPEFSLIPQWAQESVARVLTSGARKYEVNNWKYVPNGAYRYKNAALRHINSYMKGEKKDPESGENHLAHAICCLLFMLDADESGVSLADEKGNITNRVIFDVPAQNSIFNFPGSEDTKNINLSGNARPTTFFKSILTESNT